MPTSEERFECSNIGDGCGDVSQRLSLPSCSIVVGNSNEQSFLRSGAAAGRYATIVGHGVEGKRKGVKKDVGVGDLGDRVDRCPYLFHPTRPSSLKGKHRKVSRFYTDVEDCEKSCSGHAKHVWRCRRDGACGSGKDQSTGSVSPPLIQFITRLDGSERIRG